MNQGPMEHKNYDSHGKFSSEDGMGCCTTMTPNGTAIWLGNVTRRPPVPNAPDETSFIRAGLTDPPAGGESQGYIVTIRLLSGWEPRRNCDKFLNYSIDRVISRPFYFSPATAFFAASRCRYVE
jgi:hypothetical protein